VGLRTGLDRIRSPDRPARSQSLYRLRCLAHGKRESSDLFKKSVNFLPNYRPGQTLRASGV